MAEYICEVIREDIYFQQYSELKERLIRCKNCKHYDKNSGSCAKGHIHGYAETWFCADGESKKGEEHG